MNFMFCIEGGFVRYAYDYTLPEIKRHLKEQYPKKHIQLWPVNIRFMPQAEYVLEWRRKNWRKVW